MRHRHHREMRYSERFRLGVAVSQNLEQVHTWEEIAAELGMTRQAAYVVAMSALGTVTIRLQERFRGAALEDF